MMGLNLLSLVWKSFDGMKEPRNEHREETLLVALKTLVPAAFLHPVSCSNSLLELDL